jgi:ketosteroid isomerase-like protein
MSEENVEIARKILDAGNRRDTEAILQYADPEIELQSAIIGGAEGNTYRGHQGIRDWIAESDAAFEELRMEHEEFRDLGDDVLLIGRLHARGRESGVEIESAIAWLTTFRGGRIVRARGYLDPKEALEAAGLSQ